MENDVNCFTLAESVIGAGKGKNIIFGLTLGSGVGGGLVINSKIYQGAFGAAGEIGHSIIKFNGEKCKCGNFGCFEEYGSKRFFQRKKVTSKELEKTTNQGKKNSREIFKEYGKYLGIGIANIVNILDPEIIIIGGGLIHAHKYFMKTAEKEAKKRILSPLSKKNLQIKISKLGAAAGAVGAALNILSKNSRHLPKNF